MILEDELQPAFAALDTCTTAIEKLDAACCDPGRSPDMIALAASIEEARSRIGRVGLHADNADEALRTLEDAGARVGRLQVGCCAPNRLPLYTTVLEGLTTAQLALNRALDRGH